MFENLKADVVLANCEKVLCMAENFLNNLNTDKQSVKLYHLALQEFQRKYGIRGMFVWFGILPHLGYSASGKADFASLLPLMMSLCLFCCGYSLLDSYMDNELTDNWKNMPNEVIEMTAYNLINELSNMVILNLTIDENIRLKLMHEKNSLQIKIFSEFCQDIQWRKNQTWNVQDCIEYLMQKNSDLCFMLCSLGSIFANTAEAETYRFLEIIQQLGFLFQIGNDCADLFFKKWSQDLANSSYTLPIVAHIQNLSEPEKITFLTLLEEAKESSDAQQRVRTELKQSGQDRSMMLLGKSLYCQIQQELNSLSINEVNKYELENLILPKYLKID